MRGMDRAVELLAGRHEKQQRVLILGILTPRRHQHRRRPNWAWACLA